MGELYNPFPKLPKNIRQIGERDQIVKLYVEDYVNTYLRRLYPTGAMDLRIGLLLGSMEINDGTPYLFVDGAMEMEEVTEEGQKVAFTELAWKKAYQSVEQMFPKRSILGWFLCGSPGADLSPLNYWKQHVQYFQGPSKLMYLNSGNEGEESIYITSEDGFYKLCGYSIYYERNQMMQDYMVLRKDTKKVESGTDDKVITEFRKRMDERKEEVTDKRQTVSLLRGMCTAMSIVILAGGIVMFNNYGKMQEMESVIASALPEKAQTVLMGKNDNIKNEKEPSHVIVEEAEGGLSPTSTVQKETMAETQPEKSDELQTSGGQAATAETKTPVKVPETNAEPAPKATAPATPAVNGNGQRTHLVQDGETLYGICLAEYHNLSRLKEICELNGLEDENKIVSGQELLLP